MNRGRAGFCMICTLVLGACSAPSVGPKPEQLPAPKPSAAAPAAPQLIPPLTHESYKKAVAERIASLSPDVFTGQLPELFKSIVVLDITIDRDGRLVQVLVRRSNGYEALERKAIESVQRAAPFGAPAFTVRGRDGSVNFLETFLFRDDGRFRIRTLVEQS